MPIISSQANPLSTLTDLPKDASTEQGNQGSFIISQSKRGSIGPSIFKKISTTIDKSEIDKPKLEVADSKKEQAFQVQSHVSQYDEAQLLFWKGLFGEISELINPPETDESA